MDAELTINGKDARREWGLVMSRSALGALMLPAAAKDAIQSEVAIEDGTRTILPTGTGRVRRQRREVTLEIGIRGRSRSEFLSRLDSFVAELEGGWLMVRLPRHRPGTVYRMRYVSFTQFTDYGGRLAKFMLKLEEPNPGNR